MIKRDLCLLLLLAPLSACATHITDSGALDPSAISVLTQHNDNTRAGWNGRETILTTSNVNVQHFGAVFTLTVDDEVYAQPLVVANVQIDNGYHNVVYVATVNNTVYAFDGDNGRLYWKRNFTAPGMRPPLASDMTGACGGTYNNFSGYIGIVGTPVIDSAQQVIYFVTRSTTAVPGAPFVQDLHAVNIVAGNEVAGSPVRITATYAGNGDGSVGNVITFDGQKQNQRQGLTLVNGMLYVSFSSHCDWGPYHGWILGYDATTLQRRIVYNDSPNGYGAGMWESGMGMAADAQGNLYVVTGNGTVGDSTDPTGPGNRGESALKLTPFSSTLQIASYFTPYNFQTLNDYDLDYGTMGSLLMPNSNYFVTGGKDGNLYLLDKDNMGGWVSGSNQVRQVVPLNANANMHCQAAYFGGTTEFFYVWAENDVLRAIPFDRGSNMLNQAGQITNNSGGPTGQSGAVLSVSSNGSKDGTGIVWASYAISGDAESFVSVGILRAFDANDVTHELWNNHQNLSRDAAGLYAKFSPPTIANGHVYLPTFSNQVVVYGLR
ncbi:MAG TPA: PQQ-binding-like beta-propeller repeat protein [Gemmatimonadales bacterium]|nr:PQQ-binding-like beta-propeller repeat protein [Gemmatimonadales bacterium]